MSTIKLNRNQTFDLIKIYKNYEYLWNQKNEMYKRSDLKRKAWHDIANRFKCSVDDIKKKIRYLRSAYIFEKRKVDDCARTGGHYEPNLFYYKQLDFLKPTIMPRRITDFGDESTCNGFYDTETSDRFYSEEIEQKPFDQGTDEVRNYLQIKELPHLTLQQEPKDICDDTEEQRDYNNPDEGNNALLECNTTNNENYNKNDSRYVTPLRLKARSISSKDDENEQTAEMISQTNTSIDLHNKDDTSYVPPLKIKLLSPKTAHSANRIAAASDNDDIFYHTTRVWTDKLCHLSKSQRILAEKAINDIIFHGELNMLTIEKIQQIGTQLGAKI